MATASRQCGNTAFQIGNPLLQHIGGRVHDACIDVAQFTQCKEIGCMLRIAELVAGCLVDGHSTAARSRVWCLTSMKLTGGKAKGTLCRHKILSSLSLTVSDFSVTH